DSVTSIAGFDPQRPVSKEVSAAMPKKPEDFTVADVRDAFPLTVLGIAVAVCKNLFLAPHMGVTAAVLEEQIRAAIRSEYGKSKREYESAAAAKLALKLFGSFDALPPFPQEYATQSPALLQAFLDMGEVGTGRASPDGMYLT
ncbi:hypothetical protein FOZ62_028921, partial [Perkinsus olseni]